MLSQHKRVLTVLNGCNKSNTIDLSTYLTNFNQNNLRFYSCLGVIGGIIGYLVGGTIYTYMQGISMGILRGLIDTTVLSSYGMIVPSTFR
jgi:hypothetical protein